VNFDSIKQTVDAVKRLLTDEDYWEVKRKEGLEEVKNYDVRVVVPQWVKLFERLQKLRGEIK